MLKGLDNQPFMHEKSIIFTTNKKKIFSLSLEKNLRLRKNHKCSLTVMIVPIT